MDVGTDQVFLTTEPSLQPHFTRVPVLFVCLFALKCTGKGVGAVAQLLRADKCAFRGPVSVSSAAHVPVTHISKGLESFGLCMHPHPLKKIKYLKNTFKDLLLGVHAINTSIHKEEIGKSL